MKQESEDLEDQLQALARRTRRLERCTFIVWPAIWLVSSLCILLMSRMDAGATEVLIEWIESRGLTLLIVASVVGVIAFFAKLSFDFKHRGEQFSLNPGSKGK